jgi:O-antigen ligase
MTLASIGASRRDTAVLVETAICVLPGMAALPLGQPRLGARVFFGLLSLFLLCHVLQRDRYRFVTLIAGVIPAMMLLRVGFFYVSVVGFLAAGVIVWAALSPQRFSFLWKDRTVLALLSATSLYWAVSCLVSQTYEVNIRAIELSLSAVNIYLLAQSRRMLATALSAIFLSVLAIAVALLPFGGRLGQVSVGDLSMGNPISLGLPAALILLLGVVDRGRWLLLPMPNARGWAVIAAAASILALSTSRGSWLVAMAGFCALFLWSPRSRGVLAGLTAVLAAIVLLLLQTERGETVLRYMDKALSSERSAAQRTSGRSEQWEALPQMIADSPLIGFGPGSQRAVALRYTGIGRTMHSLYLQVIAETGLFGFGVLAAIVAAVVARAVRHRRVTGEAGPLVMIVCFVTIGVTVSAFDAISGVYLGLALSGPRTRFFVLAKAAPAAAAPAGMRLSAAGSPAS